MYSGTFAVLSGLAMAAAQTTTTLVPDKPISFFALLYNSTSDCSGNANAACEYPHIPTQKDHQFPTWFTWQQARLAKIPGRRHADLDTFSRS